jgi:hypothetical protein
MIPIRFLCFLQHRHIRFFQKTADVSLYLRIITKLVHKVGNFLKIPIPNS